jgi:soluble lytic murein transglycosylase-like protein
MTLEKLAEEIHASFMEWKLVNEPEGRQPPPFADLSDQIKSQYRSAAARAARSLGVTPDVA